MKSLHVNRASGTLRLCQGSSNLLCVRAEYRKTQATKIHNTKSENTSICNLRFCDIMIFWMTCEINSRVFQGVLGTRFGSLEWKIEFLDS